MNRYTINERLKLNNIPFPDDLPEKLEIYLQMLQEWNTRMDLTAAAGDEEILDRHFADSLAVLRTNLIPRNISLIDVGTGAGFPGMVLAIARPDLQVTLLDALQKRINFLDAVRKETGSENIVLIHARAEDGARDVHHREQYDIAVARALAPLNVLCEYILPYVKKGGLALCWKGPSLKEEMEKGKKAAKLLGGLMEEPVFCPVYGQEWEHIILPVRKTGKTASAYPRKAGTPKTQPLGING